MRIYTKKGDDGSTGLFLGGRVTKAAAAPEAYGAVDEAVAALGVARAASDGAQAEAILAVQRDLFVVAAELATSVENHHKLQDGASRVTVAMVDRLEAAIDVLVEEVGLPTEFVVPGGGPAAAALDVARTVVRRAERRAVALAGIEDRGASQAVPYLNRLADYLYMLARAAEVSWTSSKKKEE